MPASAPDAREPSRSRHAAGHCRDPPGLRPRRSGPGPSCGLSRHRRRSRQPAGGLRRPPARLRRSCRRSARDGQGPGRPSRPSPPVRADTHPHAPPPRAAPPRPASPASCDPSGRSPANAPPTGDGGRRGGLTATATTRAVARNRAHLPLRAISMSAPSAVLAARPPTWATARAARRRSAQNRHLGGPCCWPSGARALGIAVRATAILIFGLDTYVIVV